MKKTLVEWKEGRRKSKEKDGGDRGEGVTVRSTPSIIDYELSPPEAPDVNQAASVSTGLFKAAKTHLPLSSSFLLLLATKIC